MVSGLHFQSEGQLQCFGINSLTANILCARHNSALSALDAVAAKFYENIGEIDRRCREGGDRIWTAISGDGLEQWMLKCVLGLAHSGNSRAGSNPVELIDWLYGRQEFTIGAGLYFISPAHTPIYHSGNMQVQSLVSPNGRILAWDLAMRGLAFRFAFAQFDSAETMGVYRPQQFSFRADKTAHVIDLNWTKGASGLAVPLNLVGTYSGESPT